MVVVVVVVVVVPAAVATVVGDLRKCVLMGILAGFLQ